MEVYGREACFLGSNGVAEENSPRREPWVGGRPPSCGAATDRPAFQSSVAPPGLEIRARIPTADAVGYFLTLLRSFQRGDLSVAISRVAPQSDMLVVRTGELLHPIGMLLASRLRKKSSTVHDAKFESRGTSAVTLKSHSAGESLSAGAD